MRLRIVQADGQPVQDGTLSIVDSSVPFPEVALLPDANGVIEVKLPPGRFTLRALGSDGRSGEVSVSAPAPDAETMEIRIR